MNITKLTSQAGSYTSVIHGNTCFTYEQLQKFVDIVRAEALEEAAKVCESTYPTYESDQMLCFDTPAECAAAIRGLK